MLIYAARLPIWALTVSPILTVLIYYFCMDSGLTDAELFGGGADRGPVFYEVMGQLHGPLLQIVANRAPLLYTFAAGLCLCGGRGGYAVWMHKRGAVCPPFCPACRVETRLSGGHGGSQAHRLRLLCCEIARQVGSAQGRV